MAKKPQEEAQTQCYTRAGVSLQIPSDANLSCNIPAEMTLYVNKLLHIQEIGPFAPEALHLVQINTEAQNTTGSRPQRNESSSDEPEPEDARYHQKTSAVTVEPFLESEPENNTRENTCYNTI